MQTPMQNHEMSSPWKSEASSAEGYSIAKRFPPLFLQKDLGKRKNLKAEKEKISHPARRKVQITAITKRKQAQNPKEKSNKLQDNLLNFSQKFYEQQ